MTTATAKLRSLLKWHGGKYYMTPHILRRFRPHRLYIEPFAGGINVLLNKPRSPVEVVADLDADLVRFWRTVRDRPDRLASDLKLVGYDRLNFEGAAGVVGHDDDVIHAVGFLVRNRMSIGGRGDAYSWSDRLRGGQPENVNAWQTIRAELPRVAARLQGVTVMRRDALELLAEFRHYRDALFYLDPPYLASTRTAPDVYAHEMTEAQHVELLGLACKARCQVVISGYPSELYDYMLAGWETFDRDIANHSANGKTKQRRTERLWIKPGVAA